jgi:hypothetical protein
MPRVVELMELSMQPGIAGDTSQPPPDLSASRFSVQGRRQQAKLALQPLLAASIKIPWAKMVLPSSSPADDGSDSYRLSPAK